MTVRMPWFRAYSRMIDDDKLKLLAFEDRWHFVALLCLKSEGLLDKGDSPDLLMRKVAVKMGLDVRTLEEVARRLAEVGLVERATLQPAKWSSLQMRSDSDSTAAERKQRQRDRERAERDVAAAANNALNQETGSGGTDASRVTGTDVTRTEEEREEEAEEENTVNKSKIVGAQSGAAAPPAATPPTQIRPKKSSEKRAGRLADDWVLPKKWGDWALTERPDLTPDDVRREAAIFADHWQSMGGQRARKVDWFKTWCNWVRRCDGPKAAGRIPGRAPNDNTPTETFAQRAARQRMEEVAPMAARKAPGSEGSFAAAQRFMAGGSVIDVTARSTTPRIEGAVS